MFDLLVIGEPDRDEALETASGEIGREVNEVVMTKDEYEARVSRGDGLAVSIASSPTIRVIG